MAGYNRSEHAPGRRLTTGTDGPILNIQSMFDGWGYILVFGPSTFADVDS